MERTEVNVTAKISFHDVLNALALLANVYPMERVAEYQIERIERAAQLLRERMKSYEAKNTAAPAFGGTITPAMPSGWSYTSAVPVAEEAKVDLQRNAASSAKTVMNRRMGPITRRKHSTIGSPSRRYGKGRRKDDTGYSGLPYASLPYAGVLPIVTERRIGPDSRRKVFNQRDKQWRRKLGIFGRRKTDKIPFNTLPKIEERRGYPSDRRKVNDWAHPDRGKRISFFAAKGRRSTDGTPYKDLPVINIPPPMAEANQDRTKRRK